jgi:hypothetical protein
MLDSQKKIKKLFVFTTLLSFFSLLGFIFYTDPDKNQKIDFILFYLSLFIFFLSLFTLLGILLRSKIKADEIFFLNLKNSFRQALFFALFIVLIFWLASVRISHWWVNLTLIFFIIIFEIFCNLKN